MIDYSIKYWSFLILCFLLISCSNDESSNNDRSEQLTLEDFTITVDELPINANDFLGTLVSNMEGSYSIINENPTGALAVDSDTGDITIFDVNQFNYELNPVITATIQISTGDKSATGTITVNLNDIDEILFYLSDSKQDYIDANSGDWIMISELEYDALALTLEAVNKVATTDEYYELDVMINGANHPATWSHDNGVSMPDGSYVFAVKYVSFDDDASGTKIKQSSTSAIEGYTDLGNVLPTHNSGEHFFVLKGNTTAIFSEGFLAIYSPDSIGFKLFTESLYAGDPGDSNNFFNINLTGSILMYQGLSTTLKQWN